MTFNREVIIFRDKTAEETRRLIGESKILRARLKKLTQELNELSEESLKIVKAYKKQL